MTPHRRERARVAALPSAIGLYSCTVGDPATSGGSFDRALLTARDEADARRVLDSRAVTVGKVSIAIRFMGNAAADVPPGVVLWSLKGGLRS